MVTVVFYFHAHQPFRISRIRFFEIGKHKNYFNDELNRKILKRVVEKCYKPTNNLLLKLIREYDFKVSFSLSGTLIEQLDRWFPEILDLWRKLVDTGNVELVAETYYHSLAFLFSEDEFKEQIKLHMETLDEVFGYKPKAFRNTELIYSNYIGKIAEKLKFRVVLAEGTEKILGWRSPSYIYKARGANVRLLLRHYKLSDDIAFRFSNPYWEEYPLTAEKFARWVDAFNGNGYVVNLFMDYETFGEHQWPETGIFKFLEHLPKEILKNPDNDFATVTEAALRYPVADELDVPYYVSWADIERDLSAWVGDKLQQEALKYLASLERKVKTLNDKNILDLWRKLSTSDHFYYMSLKFNSDGDIHKYFREEAFGSPYDAFIYYMNILRDLEILLKERLSGSAIKEISNTV